MALAIAQGVASGADLGDGKGKTMTVDRTKTTMPQAVTALVEEALVSSYFISTAIVSTRNMLNSVLHLTKNSHSECIVSSRETCPTPRRFVVETSILHPRRRRGPPPMSMG